MLPPPPATSNRSKTGGPCLCISLDPAKASGEAACRHVKFFALTVLSDVVAKGRWPDQPREHREKVKGFLFSTLRVLTLSRCAQSPIWLCCHGGLWLSNSWRDLRQPPHDISPPKLCNQILIDIDIPFARNPPLEGLLGPASWFFISHLPSGWVSLRCRKSTTQH